MTNKNELCDLSSRFLEAMKRLGISGYRLKQDGIIKNESTLTKIKQGIQRPSYDTINLFCEKYDINPAWIHSGKGDMLNCAESNNISSKPSSQPTEKDYKLIPLIHIDSVGGMHSTNDVIDAPEYIEKYVPFLEAHDGDMAIFQSGDSMIPTIPPGSILQIRKVENWREYFGYGGIFVLLLTDGRRITKEVNRYTPDPKNYVMCISHNPAVADEELPKSMIAAVWKVIKILTDRGW